MKYKIRYNLNIDKRGHKHTSCVISIPPEILTRIGKDFHNKEDFVEYEIVEDKLTKERYIKIK